MDAPAALYRRYRPQQLADVVGQDPAVRALTGALANGRVSHAYLFSGPRGTGKTSTARILAKALNCTDPDGVEPCGACRPCRDITHGRSVDVMEIDAASNNGVDHIRELVSRASIAATGHRKVYVIDEAHMLSQAASNALLKTLEEPPGHVVFVLATTDPQRVLPTIRSRTQHLEFRLVRPDVLTGHLRTVAADAELDATDEMLAQAVLKGGGSVRDALSALDTIAASGLTSPSVATGLLEALATADRVAVLKQIRAAITDGVEARALAEDTFAQLQDLFLVQMGAEELTATPDGGRRRELATTLGPRRTVMVMDALGDAIQQMGGGYHAEVNLQVALARYCTIASQQTPSAS